MVVVIEMVYLKINNRNKEGNVHNKINQSGKSILQNPAIKYNQYRN
jgi:hypothetical protein